MIEIIISRSTGSSSNFYIPKGYFMSFHVKLKIIFDGSGTKFAIELVLHGADKMLI